MKCKRISDREMILVLLEKQQELLRSFPDCSPAMAAFDALHRAQGSKTRDAVADINQRIEGAVYTSNVYGKWRRFERPVPRAVESYMRGEVLRCCLGDTGELLAKLLGEE